ncbi:hypothetical protein M6B22_05130 [Jatrophihabitans cynanchi]|uniref:Uncharacterized protein n=1 Tax=Jatrophihabitans cynanchi TaxID=2944128 RepID=A0ABY7K015_9ACTN|nr:hypothetical protein [Jatrophihabitans sp. SB3-54]WAX58152.1 hypothetical protein M6B22_05130 [Jatrophihabitans sp. SB3-54]
MGRQLRPFDRMRRHRRDAEYPPSDAPELTAEDAEDDIPRVKDIVGIAENVLDRMSPF